MGGITSVSEVWTSVEYLINELMNALRVQDTCRPMRSLTQPFWQLAVGDGKLYPVPIIFRYSPTCLVLDAGEA
jgi:hypothetical protein